jgi:hypothetical protein
MAPDSFQPEKRLKKNGPRGSASGSPRQPESPKDREQSSSSNERGLGGTGPAAPRGNGPRHNARAGQSTGTRPDRRSGSETKKNWTRGSAENRSGGSATTKTSSSTSQHSKESETRRDQASSADEAQPRPKLGVGGTSYASRPGSSPRNQDGSSGLSNKKKAALVGAASAPPVASTVLLIMFLNWLKSFFFAMLAKALSLLHMIVAWVAKTVVAAAKIVATPFLAVGSVVAKGAAMALGSGSLLASTPIAAAAVGASSIAATTALVASALSGAAGDTSMREGSFSTAENGKCAAPVSNAGDKTGTSGGGGAEAVSGDQDQNAKSVYSVLKKWGMADENIAGILGNWSAESQIDPTSVEGIFDEPYKVGPRKQKAEDSGFSHMGYVQHSGIGLGQWTNDRNELLRKYAKEKGKSWSDLGLQLQFMADEKGDSPTDAAVFQKLIHDPKGSPAEAATFFHSQWERSADGGDAIAARGQKAEMWFGKMSGWNTDDKSADDLVGNFVAGGEKAETTLSTSKACAKEQKKAGGKGTDKSGKLADGGMTLEQAQELTKTYNDDGDAFLRNKYHGGGPGQCNGNYLQNCVSFSVYFANKYTNFDKYPSGSGVSTASSIAGMSGKETSKTPKPYSVFSHGQFSSAGHTGVVLGVEGEDLIIGEASYCDFDGRARRVPANEWKSQDWEFVDMSDQVKKDQMPT